MRPKEDLQTAFAGAEADLIVVGHTHWPMRVELDRLLLVNSGSVGNPIVPGQYVRYALIGCRGRSYAVRHRLVAYDVQAALERA